MLDEAAICPLVFGTSRNLFTPLLDGYEDNLEDIHRVRWFKTATRA